jgi:4-hydroxybenzoate polyprenyltransferase
MQSFKAFLENLRPRQWSKNLVLFAGLIFAQKFTEPACFQHAFLGFIVFCLASGAVYIYNDIVDRHLDRAHPYKQYRPIASGRLPVRTAAVLATLLMLVCLAGSAWLGQEFLLVTMAFFLWNGFYSRLLKRAVILDVVGIAVSFVLRAVASVAVLLPVVPDIAISKWLLVCTFFLSLFLGFAKRRNEIIHVSQTVNNSTRPALTAYTETLLNVLIGISFTLTLLVYTLYTVWPGTVEHFGTSNLVFSLPFVVYGLGRYLFLVYKEGRGGRPHEILLNDPALQIAVGGWIVTVVLIIGLRP